MMLRTMAVVCTLLTAFLIYFLQTESQNIDNDGISHSNGYKRVVSLAPSMTETMLALKESHRLVGVTIHCRDASLLQVPRIGSFSQPNFEAIMGLKPDLVLAVPHVMVRALIKEITKNDISVFAHQPDSMRDIHDIVDGLANLLGVPERGAMLNAAMEHQISQTALSIENLDIKNRSMLLALSNAPLVVAGKNTFASEIIEKLGLINMASDMNMPWPIWPLENLLSDPPHFLILADGSNNLKSYNNVFKKLGLDPAKNKMHLIVPDRPIFQSPSPALIEDARYLAHLLNQL